MTSPHVKTGAPLSPPGAAISNSTDGRSPYRPRPVAIASCVMCPWRARTVVSNCARIGEGTPGASRKGVSRREHTGSDARGTDAKRRQRREATIRKASDREVESAPDEFRCRAVARWEWFLPPPWPARTPIRPTRRSSERKTRRFLRLGRMLSRLFLRWRSRTILAFRTRAEKRSPEVDRPGEHCLLCTPRLHDERKHGKERQLPGRSARGVPNHCLCLKAGARSPKSIAIGLGAVDRCEPTCVSGRRTLDGKHHLRLSALVGSQRSKPALEASRIRRLDECSHRLPSQPRARVGVPGCVPSHSD